MLGVIQWDTFFLGADPTLMQREKLEGISPGLFWVGVMFSDPSLFTNGCFLAPNSRWENFVNILGVKKKNSKRISTQMIFLC